MSAATLKICSYARSLLRRHGPRGLWAFFWMRQAGRGPWGRLATRLASLGAPPYKERAALADLTPHPYVAPGALLRHPDLHLGEHVFVDEGVVIYHFRDGGPVRLEKGAHVYRNTCLETGSGGRITVGAGAAILPHCQLIAHVGSIHIGAACQIAQNCAFYPYDHGIEPGVPIVKQPLRSRGDIVLGDDVWLGTGATILAGVRIGEGAVIGAGAVVTRDIPEGAIAVGVPARVIGTRSSSENRAE